MTRMYGYLLEGDRCPLCGNRYIDDGKNRRRRTRDHILPRVRGKLPGDIRNLRAMCASCNSFLSACGHCVGTYACIATVSKDMHHRFGFVLRLWKRTMRSNAN